MKVLIVVVAFFVAVIFVAAKAGNDAGEAAYEFHRGRVVARICRDGSYIWKYRDGVYRDRFSNVIEDIEKVCAP